MEEFSIVDNTKNAGVWTVFDHANNEPLSDHESYADAMGALSNAYTAKARRIARMK